MLETSERKRIKAIQRERDALYLAAAGRPAAAIEDSISIVATLTGIRAPSALFFRMTADEIRRDEELVDEQNSIVAAVRRRQKEWAQTKVNAQEVADVRASACPDCFSTHKGEC
jgi:hypothetical protein